MHKIPITPIMKPSEGSMGSTGTWRIVKPVVQHDKCTYCLQCWLHCPESAIVRVDEERKIIIDYNYCKGCGICSDVCPVKAIIMVEE